MRWVRFTTDGRTSYGIVEGDAIEAVSGSPFERWERTGHKVTLAGTKLEPPVIPPTFYAAGLNYTEHLEAAAKATGRTMNVPKRADIGYRANNALVGHEDAIVIPAGSSGKVQFEGELVAVIGKRCKHVSKADALSVVFGYTIGNDVSERVWQGGDRTLWRAKNTDTFKPMGPWIETDADLDKMVTEVRVNGKQASHFKTNTMLFDLPTYIEEMTKYLTLYPGDVIWLGTDGATPDMVDGDVCEVEISGIGVLRNPVRAEQA